MKILPDVKILMKFKNLVGILGICVVRNILQYVSFCGEIADFVKVERRVEFLVRKSKFFY